MLSLPRRTPLPFYVYRLTAPSGKFYVGVTTNVKERWRLHVGRAIRELHRHPLSAAIRKYGPETFTIETLEVLESQASALTTEIRWISELRACDRNVGFNLSAGGEYDAVFGRKVFWDRMRADPEAFANYKNKLQKTQKARGAAGLIDAAGLIAANAALPAKERWKRAYRASRVARREQVGKPSPMNGKAWTGDVAAASRAGKAAWAAQPPSKKKRHARTSKEAAKALWARRTKSEIADVSLKISASVKELHEDPAYRKRNLEGLAKGRRNMDRQKQGAAASVGLKEFWRNLKEDPEKYKEHMAQKTATLLRTIEKNREKSG